ncbi:OmpA family protein [Photobacterium leiognathi]|uniref:OmpA family protein n=1 Tax=Photobacterium leiognathi TaxID=553611 RepID=UPI000D1794E7|nr:OmpA family protein [Photobacterium leiognathi]PSW65005.1 OmpA family protein [Photobacterium leiognathi subsp. mandapamensis]
MKVRLFLLLVCTYMSGCVSDRAIYADYGPLACQKACPQVVIDAWPSVVNFGFDKSELTPAEMNRLANAVNVLQQNPSFKVAVVGSTDPEGSEEYNDALSMRRAQVVGDYLQSQGISPSRMTLIGTGERELFIHTDSRSDNRANRRTQLILLDANHEPVTMFFDKSKLPLEPNIMNPVNSL